MNVEGEEEEVGNLVLVTNMENNFVLEIHRCEDSSNGCSAHARWKIETVNATQKLGLNHHAFLFFLNSISGSLLPLQSHARWWKLWCS